MKYTPEFKTQVVEAATQVGMLKAAAVFGVPKTTLYGWKNNPKRRMRTTSSYPNDKMLKGKKKKTPHFAETTRENETTNNLLNAMKVENVILREMIDKLLGVRA